MRNDSRGFVALMSVIIIGAILSVLVFTMGATTFFSRFDVVETEYKRVSLAYAEACVDAGMLKIAQGTPVTSPITITIDSTSPGKYCKLCSASGNTIYARAAYNGAYTNLSVNISNPSPGLYSITDWEEKAANTVPSCSTP